MSMMTYGKDGQVFIPYNTLFDVTPDMIERVAHYLSESGLVQLEYTDRHVAAEVLCVAATPGAVVTAEMVEAGYAILTDSSITDEYMEFHREVVAKIYRAMEAQRVLGAPS